MSVPNIPALSSKIAPEVRKAFDSLRGWFTSVSNAGGLATMSDVSSAVAGGGGTLVVNPGIVPEDIPLMAAPTGFVVVGAFATIILAWDEIVSSYYAHMEVWRASVNDIGQAVLIGSSPGTTYSDTPPEAALSITYYYWIRAVNTADLPGPYNATAGTAGRTADNPTYVLELLLNSKWKANTTYGSGSYVYPTRPNGYAYKVTTAGTSGATEPTWPTSVGGTVSDNGTVFTCDTDLVLDSPFMIGLVNGIVRMVIRDVLIGDATITNAKIQTLAADKIFATTGTIAAALIGSGHIDNAMIANIIQSSNFVTGSAGWRINKAGNCEFNGGTFRGAVVFQSGSSGYTNLSDKPTSLASINSAESTKLTGIAAGATVGAPSGTLVGSTAATTVESNASTAITRVNAWVKPGYTLINGNQIYTGDAYVDTLQIQGEAVTLVSGASLTSPINTTSATFIDSGVQVAVTVPSTIPNMPIMLMAHARGDAVTSMGGGTACEVKITRNGVDITGGAAVTIAYDFEQTGYDTVYWKEPATFTIKDVPGSAGTYTYKLQYRKVGRATAYLNYAGMSAVGCKR